MIDRRAFSLTAAAGLVTSCAPPQTYAVSLVEAAPNPTLPRNPWGPPYTQAELDDAQARFGLTFPPDLVAVYRQKRPVEGWDWTRDEAKIRDMLAWPYEGLLFDVENNDLWRADWGQRPATPDARAATLRRIVDAAPRLIPILGHRFIPEAPHLAGNPVFSVYQSDIIYYGADLDDYFAREFTRDLAARDARPWPPIRRIAFWSDFTECPAP